MIIKLEPVNDNNREAVLALSVREDQPFVAPNDYSLNEAEETNKEHPGTARPFAICADDRLVGFCMFAFDPDVKDPDDRYWLWRFMIDRNEQGKGYGQAALQEIIKYFKENGADRLFLSTGPENETGLHVYHKAGFRETGIIDCGEAVLMRMLKGPNRIIKNIYGVDVDKAMRIKGKKGYGVSIAVRDGDGDLLTYCAGSGRYGEDFPVNPDMLFQAGSVSKPMFALTLLRYVDKGLIRAGIRQKRTDDLRCSAFTHGQLQPARLPGLSGKPRTAFARRRSERKGQYAEAQKDPSLRQTAHVLRRRNHFG